MQTEPQNRRLLEGDVIIDIRTFLDITIDSSEDLPRYICHRCNTKIFDWKHFRQKANSFQDKLKQLEKTEISESDCPIPELSNMIKSNF